MEQQKKKQDIFTRFLNTVERAGNRMCDPITLFVCICLIIVVCSALFNGASVVNPATGEDVTITSLMTFQNFVWMLSSFTSNIANFPTLILGLVVVLGVGLFESTGLASALMRVSVLRAPEKLIIPLLLLISVNSNIAGDAGFLIMPMIGALVFMSLGKNPIAGMALCYAGVAGGFSANFLVGSTDALLIGYTGPAAQFINPEYQANIMCNWYFMAASAVFLTIVGTVVNKLFVEARVGAYHGVMEQNSTEITAMEKRGLRAAGIAFLVLTAVLAAMCIPADSPMRDETGSLLGYAGGLIQGIVPIIMLMFFVPSSVYAFATGLYKNDKDLVKGLVAAVSSMSGYVTFCIVAAQMIAYFNKSCIGTYIAIRGADFLGGIGLTGIPLIILFILLCSLINILVASASAKWAFLAPVFVPMFMLLGYDPSFTQVLYRIGDSITNPITPMFAYFAMLVGLAEKYDKKAGIGSLMSCLLPYSLAFFVFWSLFIILWITLGIPLGPGASVYLK
ncbi:MAG: AbgT family transporter [Eubacteriales bacterium]|nr:AbgT family transporter [Eubacteriales bacterium]